MAQVDPNDTGTLTLAEKKKRLNDLAGIKNKSEHLGTINAEYQTVFGRDADASGSYSYLKRIQSGELDSPLKIRKDLMKSQEYKDKLYAEGAPQREAEEAARQQALAIIEASRAFGESQRSLSEKITADNALAKARYTAEQTKLQQVLDDIQKTKKEEEDRLEAAKTKDQDMLASRSKRRLALISTSEEGVLGDVSTGGQRVFGN